MLSICSDTKVEVWTKWSVLSVVVQIYDPLGLIAPCVLALKLFLQECWKKEMLWDDPILSQAAAHLRQLIAKRDEIQTISIPRLLWSSLAVNCLLTLHVFTDASRKAYGCAVYLVKHNEHTGTCCSGLLYTKQWLAPCKQQSLEILRNKCVRPRSKQAKRRATRTTESNISTENSSYQRTIPQLELLGATLGVCTIKFVLSQLHEKNVKVKCSYLWNDATTVLQWLHSAAVLSQFVEKRLQKIKGTPNLEVRYMPTLQNPADYLTWGKSADDIHNDSLWWYGPNWITQENLWPEPPVSTITYKTPSVLLATFVASKVSVSSISLLSDALERRYLHWDCYIKTFSKFRKAILKHRISSYDSTQEIKQLEIALIRAIQMKYFMREILQMSNGCQPNAQLGLFFDKHRLIHCQGRLINANLPWEVIHPILLPRKSQIVVILLNTIH